VKTIVWNHEKNLLLIEERHISFEVILECIDSGNLLDVLEHSNKQKYPEQKILIVKFQDYIYLVPFVEDSEKIFLKTIIPSRKMTEKYLDKIK
jgi:uncharacterized DUF497 family protein